jgi:hypothetical protein
VRVLFLIRSWHIGGAQTYALQMMQEFRARGHSVGFVAGHPGGELWMEASQNTFCSEVMSRDALRQLMDKNSVFFVAAWIYL